MNNARTPQFYMANLGSEVSGIISAVQNGDKKRVSECYNRAQKIIRDFKTIEKNESAIEEVDFLEKILNDIVLGNSDLKFEKTEFEEYFMPFAMRVLSN